MGYIPSLPTSLPANGGNADTATKLATARNINGKPFNGTADIWTALNNVMAPTNTDLNTLTNGRWSCINNGGVAIPNEPLPSVAGHWCYVIVWDNRTNTGEWTQLATYDFITWYRRYYAQGAWLAWVTLPVGRKKAIGNMTFYLRTDGSNSNDGTTEATAMQTFNALMQRIYKEWDFQGHSIHINIGAGTWAGETWRIVRKLIIGNSLLTVFGAGMGQTIVANGNTVGLSVETGGYDPSWLRLQAMTFANNAIHIDLQGSCILFREIEFGNSFDPASGSLLRVTASYVNSEDGIETNPSKISKITAPQTRAIIDASINSRISIPINLIIADSLTLLGAAFILVNSQLQIMGNSGMTGAVTGKKYQLYEGSTLYNSTFAPGSIAGSADASSYAL
jgi:hypothetical protein